MIKLVDRLASFRTTSIYTNIYSTDHRYLMHDVLVYLRHAQIWHTYIGASYIDLSSSVKALLLAGKP